MSVDKTSRSEGYLCLVYYFSNTRLSASGSLVQHSLIHIIIIIIIIIVIIISCAIIFIIKLLFSFLLKFKELSSALNRNTDLFLV